ncbi:nucleotidyltransferase family protein [Pedobacter arcticus]|uniref:nucleotidyltransferase family protein n=1 Tax=Pedobacter arcticus TaxID=752140 RepID=UPI0002ECA99F|nr:nucleotidyltransferase family protein [Pedobacter arcticus]
MLSIGHLKTIYGNEETLIILITRLYFDKQSVGEVNDFLEKEEINWLLFYKLVQLNDIRGFVYEIVITSNISIDQSVFNALKKDTVGIILFGKYQLQLLNHLSQQFSNLGIRVINYKGVRFANRYYRSLSMRESADIDFLIKKDDLSKLRECLLSNDFISTYDVSEHQIGFLKKYQRELSLKSPKDKLGINCSVELQWKLVENYFGKFYEYDFLAKHLTHDSNGTISMALSPTYDFLCIASHHLIREPLLKFKYLIDLACIIDKSGKNLNWEEIAAGFKRYKFSPFLWSGVNALEEIVGIKIPLSEKPAIKYHLFSFMKAKNDRENLFKKIKLIGLKLDFTERIKFKVKAYSWLLVPNTNDLSLTDKPAWAIPLIIPTKSFKLFYSFLFNKR